MNKGEIDAWLLSGSGFPAPGSELRVLAADLYRTRENFNLSRVPALNYSRAETLASFDRINQSSEKYEARLIIQHGPDDISALSEIPEYLD